MAERDPQAAAAGGHGIGAEADAKEDENAEQAADRRAKKFREEWQSAPDDAPDPDGFVPQQGSNLPRDHELASDHAEECLLDSVRTLLCLHYEARLRDADRARRKKKAEEEEQGGAGQEKEVGARGKKTARGV